MKTHVWIETPRDIDDRRRLSVVIERPDGQRSTIWFSVPLQYADQLSTRADAFTLISLFSAMQAGKSTHIHGEVSPSLLRNLEEFQAVWTSWVPERYSMIEISADVERENEHPADEDRAIAAFSGGLDAVFTAYRHHKKLIKRRARDIKAAVMIQGYDIPADADALFQVAYQRSKAMTDSLGIPLIPVTTNYREVEPIWEEVHMSCVGACLMLFEGSYGSAIVGSSDDYTTPVEPWGSTPMTDPLLSSKTFRFVHDGAEFRRVDKLAVVSRWEEANRNLFVCWQPTPDGKNCCRCNKCILTILNYRVLGLELPPIFAHDVTDEQVANIHGLNGVDDFEDILTLARQRNITDPWVRGLSRVIRSYKLRTELGNQEFVVKLRNQLDSNPVGRRLWDLVRRK